jgi:hypothetical protein
MSIIRRSAGIGALVLSILGLLLCMVSAAGVWAAKSRVDSIAAAFFGTADDAFEFMATRLVLVNQRLGSSRQQVSSLAERAERLRTMDATGAGSEPLVLAEFDALPWTLDMVLSELKASEAWLDSIQAVAGGLHRASQSIAASQAAASPDAGGTERESTAVTAAKVAEFSGDLADALNRLKALREKLLETRENRTVAREFAATMLSEMAELDTRLGSLSTKIDDLSTRVSEARASSVDLGRRIHGWITFAAVVVTLVLVWFGVSQVCMLKDAWRLWQMSRG